MISIDEIAKAMDNIIDRARVPAQALPPILTYCTAIKRSGASATRAASNAISDLSSLGVPTDENPDGTPNIINQYTYLITKNVLKEIKENGQVQVAIPVGALTIQSTGANAGGPVTTTGTNIIASLIKGVLR